MSTNLNANEVEAPPRNTAARAWEKSWGPERRYWDQEPDYHDPEFWVYSIKREFAVDEMSMFFYEFKFAKDHLTESQWADLAHKLGLTPEALSEITTATKYIDHLYKPTGPEILKLARAFAEVFPYRD